MVSDYNFSYKYFPKNNLVTKKFQPSNCSKKIWSDRHEGMNWWLMHKTYSVV